MNPADTTRLDGKILIAMPNMDDTRFERAVIYLCAHSDDGAMGLIVNRPQADMDLREILSQLDIELGDAQPDMSVHFGGPVEHGRGFVLHTADYDSTDSTLRVDDEVAMTATLDVLHDIAAGQGPRRALLALGYAGWGPGQLEAEIRENGWLTGEATADLLFGADHEAKWTGALRSLGVDALVLSSEGGSA